MTVLVTILSLACAQPAADPARAEIERDTEWTTADTVYGALSGVAGGLAFGSVGGLLGMATGSCGEDDWFCSEELHFAAGFILAAPIGIPIGTYAYGEWSGHDGSFWATTGGFLGGALVSAAIIGAGQILQDDEARVPFFVLASIPPFAGASIGYGMSIEKKPAREKSGGVTFAAPGLRLALDEEGAVRGGELSLGGSF